MSIFNDFPHTRNSDQDFGWLIKAYEEVKEEIKAVTEGNEEVLKEIEELDKKVDEFINGGFAEKYFEVFKQFIVENIGRILPTVWFGLTDSGYFTAFIPSGWNNVIFNTTGYDIDIENVDYGHLVLSSGGEETWL